MSAKAQAHKIIRQRYYWPIIHTDAIDFVKKCLNCQLYNNIPRKLPIFPSSVISPIPFAIWGIDFMGLLPRAKGDPRNLLVAIDYMKQVGGSQGYANDKSTGQHQIFECNNYEVWHTHGVSLRQQTTVHHLRVRILPYR